MTDRKRGAKTGRSELVQIRTSKSLKERLALAAAEHERSIAAEAEHRLERSLDQDAGRGGPQIAAMLDYMGSIAALIQRQPTGGEAGEFVRFWALRSTLIKAIDRWMPKPETAPQFQAGLDALREKLPDLEKAAIEARLEAGARPPATPPSLRRRGLFGGSGLELLFSDAEPDFPVQPHTRALTPDSFTRLLEWRQLPQAEREGAGLGLLSGNLRTRPMAVREITITVEKDQDGFHVTGGAVDALLQEKRLGARDTPITEAEMTWATAQDECDAHQHELFETIDEMANLAQRISDGAMARFEVRYNLPHDELIEVINSEAEWRGVKGSH